MADSKMSRMSPAFAQEFGECLKKTSMKPNEHFQKLTEILKKHNMCYRSGVLHSRLFMTHSSNRGGLLPSPHNAHKNAASIMSAGANLNELTTTWAIELPHEGARRENIIKKNEALIARAEGLLAKLNGMERFTTVGSGNNGAWCKHADAGGATPEKKLQMSESEMIDVQLVCQDDKFKIMK